MVHISTASVADFTTGTAPRLAFGRRPLLPFISVSHQAYCRHVRQNFEA